MLLLLLFSEKIRLDSSCESIRLKCQVSFTLKNKKKKEIKMSSAEVVMCSLTVKVIITPEV